MLHQGNFEFVTRSTRQGPRRRPVAQIRRQPTFQYAHQPTRPVAKRLKRQSASWPRSLLGFALIFALIGSGGYFVLKPSPTEDQGMVNAQNTTNAEPEEPKIPPPDIDEQQMAADINGLIAANPHLDISVSYKDIKTGQSYHYGVSEHFVAASISKLLTAVLYLRDVDAGTRSLQAKVGAGTAQTQLKLLIEQSDNEAWASFNRIIGSAKFTEFATEIGIQKYDHNRNTITSADVAILLEKLHKGDLLSEESSDRLLAHMKAADNRQYIVEAIPSNVTVYHKAGYLKDRAHDAAIVDNGPHPYVLVIFTKARNADYDFVEGPTLLQSLTKAINQPYIQQ